MRDPDFTLTAGPTASSPRVLAALGSPMLYDYDPVFLERFRGLETKVAALMQHLERRRADAGRGGARARGGGRAGRHPARDDCDQLRLGRLRQVVRPLARRVRRDVVEVEVPYDAQVEPEMVEAAFAAHPETELLAVVHSETPSGTMNPVAEIGPIAKRHGALVVADVVSSLGCDDAAARRLGPRHLRRGPAEVPRRASRHVARSR